MKNLSIASVGEENEVDDFVLLGEIFHSLKNQLFSFINTP